MVKVDDRIQALEAKLKQLKTLQIRREARELFELPVRA